jgi:hypothetical protein
MNAEQVRSVDPVVRALRRDMLQASDRHVIRVVALVDALRARGVADELLAPLRQRLALLRAPRPLRLPRLIFQPLRPLIVDAAQWRIGQQAIPRTIIVPMAEQVRLAMGVAGSAIESSMAGRTTADTDVVAELGRSLWPAAAQILADSPLPKTWAATELADAIYRPLADLVATVLAEAPAIDVLRAESATGLLPPRPEIVEAMLSRAGPEAWPVLIAVLLDSVPQAAGLLRTGSNGPKTAGMRAATDAAADMLLQQLAGFDGAERSVGRVSLADAGAAAGRVVTLLAHLAAATGGPLRRGQLRAIRGRFDAVCMARFTFGLQNELVAALPQTAASPGAGEMLRLESVARGLSILAAEARVFGSGPAYSRMLDQAVEVISMRDKLGLTDRVRLIEVLAGSEAALATLERQSR